MQLKRMSIVGALVGDAAGAPLEFHRGPLTSAKIDSALKMSGGGHWGVGPGQITDDGELTLSLWHVLLRNNPNNGFPTDDVIQEYAEWCNTNQFSMGNTCKISFKKALSILEIKDKNGLGEFIKEYVKDSKSLANGSLMRVTPIAQWVAPYQEISAEMSAEFAREDAQLSHGHKDCQDANAVYTFALVNLLRKMSPEETLTKTKEFADKCAGSNVRSWFEESVKIDQLDCNKDTGFVKYGFVMAFYFLRNPTISFEEALRIVLSKGGDTDTNAAIVGGIVSLFQEIPSPMVKAVFQFDSSIGGRERPYKYSAKWALTNLIL